MRELRYSEGKDVRWNYACRRTSGGAPPLARELVDCESGCHHGCRREPIVAAKERYAHRSIVMSPAMRSPPASSRASLVQAAILTGVTLYHLELMPKRMAVFRELPAVCVPPRGYLQPRERQ